MAGEQDVAKPLFGPGTHILVLASLALLAAGYVVKLAVAGWPIMPPTPVYTWMDLMWAWLAFLLAMYYLSLLLHRPGEHQVAMLRVVVPLEFACLAGLGVVRLWEALSGTPSM